MTDSPTKLPTAILDFDALFNNPLFAGGIGLASLGAAAAFARTSAIRASSLIKRRLLVDVEISKTDPSYNWILAWLTLPRPPQNRVTAALTRVHHLSLTARIGGKNKYGGFMAQPGYGKHVIRHGNAFIAVNREKGQTANMATGEPHETITLTTLYAQRHIFEDIFQEAHILAMHAQEGKTPIYTARTADWAPFGEPRRKRPLHSVVLDEGIKEKIVDDVKDFLNRQEWYVDRGVPYRRGYLLYGPPGSGKSSFIQALAGELDFGVAIINLSERGMTDDRLSHLLTKLPRSTILLLEDCDAAFSNRRQVESDGYSGATVTFSGLLNALDGVAAAEERIVILTTNHVERLDEALIRPGRIDMTVRIGEASRYQAGLMWDRFYSDVDIDGKGKERFLQRLEQLGLVEDSDGHRVQEGLYTSAAAIQGLFLFNKDDMNGAIEMADGLIPRVYEAEARSLGVIKTPA